MTHRNRKSKRPEVNRKEGVDLTALKLTPQKLTPPRSNKTKGAISDKMEQNQSAARSNEKPASDVMDDTLNQSTERLALNKRPRPEDTDESSGHLRKRLKAKGNTGLGHRPQEPAEGLTEQDSTRTTVHGQDHKSTANATPQALPAELQHLRNKYAFTTMSILSSSKIEQKVRNLLLRVSKSNFADINAKPGIVVLHAKAEAAGKMVSIVEIAKQEIQKENGKWYQYSKLHGEIMESKVKETKPKGGGKTLAEWTKEKSGDSAPAKTGEGTSSGVEKVQEVRQAVDDEDNEMKDAFETMALPNREHDKAEERKKVRAIPVMTIYFARVPVPGLKELYGYDWYLFLHVNLTNRTKIVSRRMPER